MSEMESMKQEAEAERKKQERVYETKNIPENELLAQAKEILRRLELKINKHAKEAFDQKRYEEASKYKRSLEALRK